MQWGKEKRGWKAKVKSEVTKKRLCRGGLWLGSGIPLPLMVWLCTISAALAFWSRRSLKVFPTPPQARACYRRRNNNFVLSLPLFLGETFLLHWKRKFLLLASFRRRRKEGGRGGLAASGFRQQSDSTSELRFLFRNEDGEGAKTLFPLHLLCLFSPSPFRHPYFPLPTF